LSADHPRLFAGQFKLSAMQKRVQSWLRSPSPSLF
jgi:hypothetical protein